MQGIFLELILQLTSALFAQFTARVLNISAIHFYYCEIISLFEKVSQQFKIFGSLNKIIIQQSCGKTTTIISP
jgi:hypothetical protein